LAPIRLPISRLLISRLPVRRLPVTNLLAINLLAMSLLVGGIHAAVAQPLDLSQGGPITVTARDGLEWHQAEQEVIARGDASAVRQNVTVTADRLVAYYRKKASADGTAPPATPPGAGAAAGQKGAVQQVAVQRGPAQQGAAQQGAAQQGAAHADATTDADTSGTEIYRLRAEGNVQIFTATDHAQGDVAVYDIDQAVLVMTGHDLKLTTPNDVLTARDTLEYWPQKHMAVARGNAVVVTKDARRLAADVLVAYTTDTPAQASAPGGTQGGAAGTAPAGGKSAAKPAGPAAGSAVGQPGSGDDLTSSGKLEKVDAFGHVSVRTPTDTAIGDRAVYVPDTGIARLAGSVRITRGQNQLDGQEAEVNMKTGIARLLPSSTGRVSGLIVPNDTTNRDVPGSAQPIAGGAPGGGAPAAKPTAPAKPTGGTP
jgi:lipopolysaccharide export system protein LptA